MLSARGRAAGSILTTGPTRISCQSGRNRASEAISARSNRSSMTPKTKPRPRYPRLIRGIRQHRPRLAKMLGVDRTRKGMHVGVLRALCLIKAHTASEDDIGSAQKVGLEAAQLGRGV